MAEKALQFPSLAQLFEAPDHYVGHFGWICGYSADAGFLNDAAERFTRQTEKQRAYTGNVALVLMLDPGHPQLCFTDVPAVLHVPFRVHRKPFNLLHAKLALLGFRHAVDRRKWLLRLTVSTGNWTRETLEDNLDLAWTIEISDHELSQANDSDVKQRCADFTSAWSLMNWLRGHFDCRALRVGPENHRSARSEFEKWIAKVSGSSGAARPRFLDSRGASLLDQIPAMIRATATVVARNYLAMGSGFYEAPDDRGAVPSVLGRIVAQLQKSGLLTRTADVDVFVNPGACQAVASSARSIRDRGWHVRKANTPEKCFGRAERALHAKFLFSANSRDNSALCNSAWVYFGSGNLTSPGFSQKMSERGGNLETGVVFAPQGLLWLSDKAAEQWRVVTNALPLQWDEEYGDSNTELRAGNEMTERDDMFVAAPVSYFMWSRGDGVHSGGWLSAPDWDGSDFELLDDAGAICHRDAQQRVWWPGEQPRQVRVSWHLDAKEYGVLVPVVDEFGRLAGTRLPSLGLDEAWSQIASFPMPPDDDDLPDSDGVAQTEISGGGLQPGGAHVREYPIRQMMELVENIAAKQTAIEKADWTSWCVRLEQSLAQAKGNEVLQTFQSFVVNPLSPLWQPPFRPKFAETYESAEGSQYEAVLKRIETIWEVSDLERLGGLT